jgi:uncharacterized membrane protein
MRLKKYLLTGVVTWLPLAVTISVLVWLLGILDAIFLALLRALITIIPESFVPTVIKLKNIPGLGIILVILLLLITGALVSNVFGRWIVKMSDALFTRIPIVKPIYGGVKKVADTLFSSNGNAFRKALLIQYPRDGCWTVAFQTGFPAQEIKNLLGKEYVSVYVPTTPNPTSGFFLILPRSEVRDLSMTVDEALAYIISMGTVNPNEKKTAVSNLGVLKP